MRARSGNRTNLPRKSFPVLDSLLQQRVLSMHEAAFDRGSFIGMESAEAAHRSVLSAG